MIPSEVQQQRDLNDQVAQFEGLVYTTARQIVEGTGLDFDDVRQVLRIKVLYAIGKFRTKRDYSKVGLRSFVFGCVYNMRKDIQKRPSRYLHAQYHSSVDALRSHTVELSDGATGADDWFDALYLSASAEQVYFEIEDEPPAWLCRLTVIERQIVKLRSDGLTYSEVESALELATGQARTAMQAVREKLADWRPSAGEPRTVPMPPLPGAEPRTARPPLARAA